jgi:21S rRNA (GM2251-2'-O)-methyltransferase
VARGIPIAITPKKKLLDLTEGRRNQGVVLECGPIPLLSEPDLAFGDFFNSQTHDQNDRGHSADQSDNSACSEIRSGEVVGGVGIGGQRPPLWLAADRIHDPMNLGSILRSAYFYGVDGVLLARGCAPLSPAVSKASSGAAECVLAHDVVDMPRLLKEAARAGWNVVGASSHDSAGARIAQRPFELELGDRPTVLVVGNEGFGLSPGVLRACNMLVSIEAGGSGGGSGSGDECDGDGGDGLLHGLVDAEWPPWVPSLNVGVATGTLLHALISQRQGGI